MIKWNGAPCALLRYRSDITRLSVVIKPNVAYFSVAIVNMTGRKH